MTAPWIRQLAIVGDSVTAQGSVALHAQFPTAIINARGGRYTAQGYEAAAGIDASNTVDGWIFALGTNDLYGWNDYDSNRAAILLMLSVVGPTDQCWWVLPQVLPSSGLSPATFVSAVPSFARPVDLHTPAADFGPDGVHLTADGYVRRAAAIAAALAA